ncbi:hypothetical protein ASF53_14075 [Methylobacterium sp. Leaf123]|nr:hypothetical protein ASF53_14075 [Methylobacterium sp. Leaf123]
MAQVAASCGPALGRLGFDGVTLCQCPQAGQRRWHDLRQAGEGFRFRIRCGVGPAHLGIVVLVQFVERGMVRALGLVRGSDGSKDRIGRSGT